MLTIKPWPLNKINSLLECRRVTMSLSYDTEDRICINSHYQSKGDKKGWFGFGWFVGFSSGFNHTEFTLSKCQKPASAQ